MTKLLTEYFMAFSLCYLTVALAFSNNNNSYSYVQHDENELLARKARWLPLIYPRTRPARFKFIAGFGIPVDDLNIESITTGYVLIAQYFLPNSAEQLRTKDIHGITERRAQDNATVFQRVMQKTDEELGVATRLAKDAQQAYNGYRWTIYQTLESMALRMKLNGRQCILKSICESASTPFDERNGLLGELLHILLTPSSSVDDLSEHSDNDYIQAEHLGSAGGDCHSVYAKCPKSLLEHFSDVHHLGSEIFKQFG